MTKPLIAAMRLLNRSKSDFVSHLICDLHKIGVRVLRLCLAMSLSIVHILFQLTVRELSTDLHKVFVCVVLVQLTKYTCERLQILTERQKENYKIWLAVITTRNNNSLVPVLPFPETSSPPPEKNVRPQRCRFSLDLTACTLALALRCMRVEENVLCACFTLVLYLKMVRYTNMIRAIHGWDNVHCCRNRKSNCIVVAHYCWYKLSNKSKETF